MAMSESSHRACVVRLLAGVILGVWSGVATALSLSAVPMDQTVAVSDTVEVAVVIDGLGNFAPDSLGVFDISVSYDPGILAFQSASFGDPVLGDQLDVFGFGSITDVTPGSGSVNLFELSLDFATDLDTLQAGSFQLATLMFSAIGTGVSAIGIDVTELGDAYGAPLNADTITGGRVAVVPLPATAYLFGTCLLGLLGRKVGARA